MDDTTANRADAYLRRQALWGRLLEIFRDHRPDDTQLSLVSTLAEVTLNQVFQARRTTEQEIDAQYMAAKDFAECGSLYGYVLGLYNGIEYAMREARQEGASASGNTAGAD